MPSSSAQPERATGALVLADGTVFWGYGIGAEGTTLGEVCFNTSMTGYQEILTDPSYAGQIITFTFPHIGNVGTNDEDIETITPAARGLILRRDITSPSNWRAAKPLNAWLKSHNMVGLAGLDTRQLTRRIRDSGAPTGTICHAPDGKFNLDALTAEASAWPGLNGMDLAAEVSCRQPYDWTQSSWSLKAGYGEQTSPKHHIVAIDYMPSTTSCAVWRQQDVKSLSSLLTAARMTFCRATRTVSFSRTAQATRPRQENMRC